MVAAAAVGPPRELPERRPVVEVEGDDRRRGGVPRPSPRARPRRRRLRERARRSPPQWNQRAPSRPKIAIPVDVARPELRRSGVRPRSEQPRAAAHAEAAFDEVEPVADAPADPVVGQPDARTSGRHRPAGSDLRATARPGCRRSAVTIAVRRPKQRRSPRATLYSPPPSETRTTASSRSARRRGRSAASPRRARRGRTGTRRAGGGSSGQVIRPRIAARARRSIPAKSPLADRPRVADPAPAAGDARTARRGSRRACSASIPPVGTNCASGKTSPRPP